MATSTFEKEFKVKPEFSDEFVQEMMRKVPLTLTNDFQTKSAHVRDFEKEFKKALAK